MRLLRILGALVVIAAIAGSSFAAATKLNINPGGLQAGNAFIRGCQGDTPVSVSYGTHYAPDISTTLVDTVTVSGLVSACFSDAAAAPHTIQVVLTFGPPAGGSQDLGTMIITGPSVVYTLPAGSQPSAADLTDVHIVIK